MIWFKQQGSCKAYFSVADFIISRFNHLAWSDYSSDAKQIEPATIGFLFEILSLFYTFLQNKHWHDQYLLARFIQFLLPLVDSRYWDSRPMVDRFSSVTWPISRSTCRPTIARPLVYHQFAIDRVWNGHLRWVDWNVDQGYTCRSSYDKNSKTDKNKNRNNFCYLKGKTNSIWPSAKKYSQSLQSREVRRSSKWSFFRQSLPSRSAKSMSRSICHEELSYICLRFRPRCSCGRAETWLWSEIWESWML